MPGLFSCPDVNIQTPGQLKNCGSDPYSGPQYTAEDLPKTARKWLEDKEGVTQYSRVFKRDETIYEAEPVYRVVFDFGNASGDTVRDSLTNNGRGFSGEDASYIAQELAAQGNSNVYVALL